MVVNTTTYIGLAKPTQDELALNWTRSTDIIDDPVFGYRAQGDWSAGNITLQVEEV